MKVLIVNTSDIIGGAARATYRLHKALREAGVDSWMLVQNKASDDYTVIGPETKFQKAIGKILPTIDQLPVKFYKNKTKTLFSPTWIGNKWILKAIEKINPDIVHLHWICGGMIKIEDLTKIRKPIVWSLHDNWAFTGGCHIKWECEKYKDNCGTCARLGSNKEKDLSRKVWRRKNKTFSKVSNITIVGLSRWLVKCAKGSSLFKDKNVVNLPNPIDTKLFKPFDKLKAIALWNLPPDKKFILFGAMSISDPNKGFKELTEALNKLSIDDKNIEFVVFGSSKPKNTSKFKFKTHYVGRLYDDISLVALYSAVDVMVVPSLQENLSNAIMEALSCGTPVVAFDVGGNSDMIEHKLNGYLAKPFDTTDLANGIEWILSLSEEKYKKLCHNARDKVLSEFDSKIVATRYTELYREILKNNKQQFSSV